MKKRKILFGLVALSSVFALAACKTDEPKPTPPGPVETTTYEVTFEANGHGTAPDKVTDVSKLPTLLDLTADGWTFGGWYYDSACTKKAESGEEIKANTKLYAKWTENKPVEEKFTVTFDTQGGSAVVSVEVTKGGKVTKPATDPTKANKVFKGWYKESACTNEWKFDTDVVNAATTIYAKWEDAVVATKYKVYFHLTANDEVTPVEVEDGDLVAEPQTPTMPYKTFTHWYTSATEQTEETVFGFSTPILADTHLYAGWVAETEEVTYVLDTATLKAQTLTEDMNVGQFTIAAKNEIRTESGKEYNSVAYTQGIKLNADLVIHSVGTGKAVVYVSDRGSLKTLKLVKPDNSVVQITLELNSKKMARFEFEVTEGDYILKMGDGTPDINYVELTCMVEKSAPAGITITNRNVNFLLGRDFDPSGISISLDYQNGRQDSLEVNDTKVNVSVPEDFKISAGVKTITVSYTLNEETFTDTCQVNVCAPQSLELYDYVLVKGVTQNLQKLFKINTTFNSDNLVVKAKCLLPETTDQYIEFILDADEFAITAPKLDTAGNKTVGVTYARDLAVTADYKIEVCTIPVLSAATEVVVNVNPEDPISTTRVYNVHTINDALQFLKLAGVADNATKTISLKKNTVYKEKVEIDMPNVVLTTEGIDPESVEFNYDNMKALSATFAVIEYDALNGMLEPGETKSHSTDGSATISIRSSAENFTALFVTFKNSYNTAELYEQAKVVAGSGTQGVAVLVQADKAVFGGCYFTGYQDTLYAQVGRQFYTSCLIEGHTDYIFGYNATAYFDNCIIRTIGAGATADVNSNYNNGGYIVSTKGFSSGADQDSIKYGYIFNECDFIADELTAVGSVSLARGWGEKQAMMVMNSKLGAHISKEAYEEVTAEGKNMNDRYGKMNADPVASQLLEYGNTGDGAINISLPNTCTVVTEEVAAEYGDLNVVFGATNDKMTYGSAWNPVDQKDATVVLKNSSGEVLQILTNFGYTGGTITEAELKSAVEVPTGFTLEGFYVDAACTTKYDFATVLEATNDIYVKFVSASTLTAFGVTADSISGELKDTSVGADISFNSGETNWDSNGIVRILHNGTDNFSIQAGGSKKIKDVNGEEITPEKRLNTRGGSNDKRRLVIIDLSEFDAQKDVKLEIFVAKAGDNATTLTLSKGSYSGEKVLNEELVTKNEVVTQTITIKAGNIYYLYSNQSIQIYGINIIPLGN